MEIAFENIDHELIRRVQKGDHASFQRLVERHQDQVRKTILGMLGDASEVDDVAQEVFIRFFKSIDRFEGKSKLSTYLTRIAINLSINELERRKKRFRLLPILTRGERDRGVEQLEPADPSSALDRFVDLDSVKHALRQLSVAFRSVVVLRLIDGYSVKETAEILDLPEGTVASRLARAQKQMVQLLSD